MSLPVERTKEEEHSYPALFGMYLVSDKGYANTSLLYYHFVELVFCTWYVKFFISATLQENRN